MKFKTLLASSVASVMVLLPPPGGFLTAFAADTRDNVDPDLLYFVDCGDRDVTTLSNNDKFGIYNSVTEQFFRKDPVTGAMWGIDDTPTEVDGYPDLLTGEYTWPMEKDTVQNRRIYVNNDHKTDDSNIEIKDGCDKIITYRYARKQDDKTGPGVTYKFQLEDGNYEFEVGFFASGDWFGDNQNRKSKLTVNGEVIADGILPNADSGSPVIVTAPAEVTGGYATLNLKLTDGGKGGPMMSYIKIRRSNLRRIDTTGMAMTNGSTWNNENGAANAFDGNVNTMFDGNSGSYLRIDLGEAMPIAAIGFVPRPNYPDRMKDTAFYGSNDDNEWTVIYKVTEQPHAYRETRAVLNEIQSWRYIKYENTSDYCNVNEIYLYENYTPAIAEVPTAFLGWDAENNGFTVNFSGKSKDATAIRVYHENAESGIMEPLGTYTELDDNTGVAVYTPNTNRIYSAAFSDGTNVGTASAKTSIYSLVIEEILKSDGGESASAARIAAANKVISAGGVYLDDGKLTAEASKIMKYEGDTLSMNTEVLKGLEIGFTVKDGVIYLGSNNSELVEATGGDTGKVYKTLKIDTVNNTITFGEAYGDAASTEALTLSLDSVNIEFVETLVQELEASGADAVADFLPEL